MDILQKTKHWQNIFEQQQGSGLSIISFCREKNKRFNLLRLAKTTR
jgi:hypothetical protein